MLETMALAERGVDEMRGRTSNVMVEVEAGLGLALALCVRVPGLRVME